MSRKTVKLKKYIDINEEFIADGDVMPGHLVEVTSANKVKAHATAGGFAVPMFVLEDEMQGKTIADKIASTELAQVWLANTGEMVQALLKAGENVVIGDFLTSAGDGSLKKAGVGDVIVAQAVEALDLTAILTNDPIAVRIV